MKPPRTLQQNLTASQRVAFVGLCVSASLFALALGVWIYAYFS